MMAVSLPPVFYVSRFGVVRDDWPWAAPEGLARRASEATRVAATLAAASAPPGAFETPQPAAPARGADAFRAFDDRTRATPGGAERRVNEVRALRLGDAFDRMRDAAWAAHVRAENHARARKLDLPVWREPFGIGQIDAGRAYAALSERVEASGLKCASLEALSQAASGTGDREAAIFDDIRALRVQHARIGPGLARAVRRHRPSATGGPRRAITVRRLVDMVCLGGATLDGVLEAHGWVQINGTIRADLRHELCAALDRMRGFGRKWP